MQVRFFSLSVYSWCVMLLTAAAFLLMCPITATALNIQSYKDTITDSGPLERANHTIEFEVHTDLSAGSYIDITMPAGFTVLSVPTFAERNVELYVNGTPRVSSSSAAAGVDGITINTGSPGSFRYTLAPDFSITSGSELEFRIGNHTSLSLDPVTSYSTSTGTTTTPGDIEPIVNANTLGRHDIEIEIYDGGLVASAEPIIFLVEKVELPSIDTTEEIPPFRFNGAPTSSVGGTTLSVEISLETDEFAICKYSKVPNIAFGSMSNTFSNTGVVFHSSVVSVTPDSLQSFYVRCLDDEGNFNTDDYVIAFAVSDTPTGTANDEGDVEGDGSGSGNEGSGDGGGGGGDTGSSDGEEPTTGGTSGGGGSGGGRGGGTGEDDDDEAGGGFETSDDAYPSGDGRVIIGGHAYPGATIVILVDGQIADTTTADRNGSYEITLEEIARGAYTFGVYGQDVRGVRSSTFSTSFTVTGSRTTALSNINILPSIQVDPDPADVGEVITISGYALANADITIENGRMNGSATTLRTTSNESGAWSVEVDSSGFRQDTYQVRVRAVQSATLGTAFSGYTFYGVGQNADVPLDADLNGDNSINLVDFSILLFWWGTNGGDSDPSADVNRDGGVNLTDFSIMLFNWTG